MVESGFTGVLGQETDLMGEAVDCWVCGQSAELDAIESTIDDLQELVEQDKRKKREVEPQVEEIDEQISEAKSAQRRVKNLEADVEDMTRKLESRRESLETKRAEFKALQDEIAEFDEEIAELESEQSSEITDLTEEIEETRVELQTVRQTIETAQGRIDTLEEQQREREEKRTRIDQLTEEINDLTDQIQNLKYHLREEFNEAMDDVVTELDFRRIERVWLDGNFDLVIARDVDGSVREDTLDSLAESEREVVGLVLALAGYAAFDLEEIAPILVIDTLGALDAKRTERFLEYFNGKPEYLIASVLPENAGPIGQPTVNPADQMRQEAQSD